MDKFKTISKNESVQIEEKKSKFIAQIFYVETIEQVNDIIKEIRKKYFDARHHCYAYRLLEEENEKNINVKEKSSDDGEPNGTAGAPMLNILKNESLYNILVVVTRYFGGILLGTGGLVRAYSEATSKAIEKSGLCIQENGEELEIIIHYKDLDRFKYYCNKNDVEIVNIFYEKNIQCIIKINKKEKEKLLEEKQKGIDILKYSVIGKTYIRKNI